MASHRHMEGTTIDGRYRVARELGRGAMGAVYEGTQISVDRRVAIKVLHSGMHERGSFEQRFEIEAKAVARLDHPNCITLFDFGYCAENEVFFMVTEYVKGIPLADYLDGDLLPFDLVANLGFQLSDALVHAHNHGVLHRDLKPENIMIQRRDSGRYIAKILDFGLARLYAESLTPENPDQRLTQKGSVFGTPIYMSPEQALGSQEITPATDLYSLGVILFELLEGHPPFAGTTIVETMRAHVSDPVPPMRLGRAPEEIEELIGQMLSKDARDRPRGAEDVTAVLFKYASTDPTHEMSLSSLEETDAEEIEEISAPEEVALEEKKISAAPMPTLPPGAMPGASPLAGRRTEFLEPAVEERSGPRMWPVALALLLIVVGVGATLWITREPTPAPAPPVDTEEAGVVAETGVERAETEEPAAVDPLQDEARVGAIPSDSGIAAASPDAGVAERDAPEDETSERPAQQREEPAARTKRPAGEDSPSKKSGKKDKKEFRTLDLNY